MYLITVEGGDGSGKGEAVRILANLASKLAFPKVHVTHEPRRHSKLGKIALSAVSKGDHTPLEEAGLFAADRVDHSHTWIRPKLLDGDLVISDRNIHSSLVYQGVVGDLGLEQVAKMNSAAMIPDLVIWIDCDPSKAMKRISSGTLRIAGEKHEYFEYALDKSTNKYVVISKDHKAIKQKLVNRHVNMGLPVIYMENMKYKNTEILLRHDFEGRPLDIKYATGTMAYLHEIIKKPINILTYDVISEGHGPDKESVELEVRYRYNNGEMKRYEGGKI